MFQINVTRNYDGRFIASIPGVHKSCFAVGNTAMHAVRMAQRTALNIMADAIGAGRQMPEVMKPWFHTVSNTGVAGAADISTNVGGCKPDDIPDSLLIHPASNTIPPRPRTKMLADLPKPGSSGHDRLLMGISSAIVPSTEPGNVPLPNPAQRVRNIPLSTVPSAPKVL